MKLLCETGNERKGIKGRKKWSQKKRYRATLVASAPFHAKTFPRDFDLDLIGGEQSDS